MSNRPSGRKASRNAHFYLHALKMISGLSYGRGREMLSRFRASSEAVF